MGRISATAAIGLAAALVASGTAAAKPRDPVEVDILPTAKLDTRTGIAYPRTAVRCDPFPAGYRVILAELSGGMNDEAAMGGITRTGQPIVCDGKRRIYTSGGFSTFRFDGSEAAPLTRGSLVITAFLIIDSADGEFGHSDTESQTVKLR